MFPVLFIHISIAVWATWGRLEQNFWGRLEIYVSIDENRMLIKLNFKVGIGLVFHSVRLYFKFKAKMTQ